MPFVHFFMRGPGKDNKVSAMGAPGGPCSRIRISLSCAILYHTQMNNCNSRLELSGRPSPSITKLDDALEQWLGFEAAAHVGVRGSGAWMDGARRLAAWPFGATRSPVEWKTRQALALRWGGEEEGAAAADSKFVTEFEALLCALLKKLRYAATESTSNASDAAIAALITGGAIVNLLGPWLDLLKSVKNISVGAAKILGAMVTVDYIHSWAMLPEFAAIAARSWIELCDWTQAMIMNKGEESSSSSSSSSNNPLAADPEWIRGATCALASVALLRPRAEAVLWAAEKADPPIFAVVRALGGLELEGERALLRLRALRRAVNKARAYWRATAAQPVVPYEPRDASGWFEVTDAAPDADGLRRVLRSAIAFGPTVWRVPRTQCRQSAARMLLIGFNRLRTFGADFDVIPASKFRRASAATRPMIAVLLTSPTLDDLRGITAVVWIRFSRV